MQGYDKDLTAEKKEEQGDKGVHSFWRRGKSYIFDVRITDLDAAREKGPSIDKILERNEK